MTEFWLPKFQISPQKLMRTSPVALLLRKKPQNADLTGNEPPKAVWESEFKFMAHKVFSFCNSYNNLRRDLGFMENGKSIFYHCFTFLIFN